MTTLSTFQQIVYLASSLGSTLVVTLVVVLIDRRQGR